jgi:lipopolysaccharide/colanic/teichoic acid biosynthesis glycosyltransferase
MWCAYKIEGLIDPSARGPVYYYYWSMSAGQKIKKLKVRAVKVQYIDPQLAKQHDWRANKGEWNVENRTRIGHFAKSYYLDELPQFWSVLIGDMSLVGPRPERQFFIDQIMMKASHYRHLHKVRPGITSWGQVKYGYAENVDQMIQRLKYDIIYIENMSLLVDFKIMIYTVLIVVQGRGK